VEIGCRGNTVGGATAGDGNLITNNAGVGVDVADGEYGNPVTSNRIFGNAGKAIDLVQAGGPVVAPTLLVTIDGRLEGLMAERSPGTTFLLQFFATAGYRPDGNGEAQDLLGSMTVTTDSRGQAVFDVPVSPPANLPVITATATDPRGYTSEVSAVRRAVLEAPSSFLRAAPGHPLVFSAAAGDGIALADPAAGSLAAAWDLTLSVPAGTLTLTQAAGLTGSGAGTGSLTYHGSLAALNAALDSMVYTPPGGILGYATLSISARSEGAAPLDSQLVITGGFLVTTAADSGPGSLRQAILDSNATAGGNGTIAFAIPGDGLHTIALQSPLPAATTSVLIDGTTQHGYAGTPLIAIDPSAAGAPDGLAVSGSEVTVRGLATSAFALASAGDASSVLLTFDFFARGADSRTLYLMRL
jgi:hypothetical protein